MTTVRIAGVLEQLRHYVGRSHNAGLSDSHLLERFLAQRDGAAFEAIVRRHGPMVLGVCRRLVVNAHDADDAFQATFLMLVRKAASLRQRELLANWLYGVAYRTAMKARAARARRREKEKPMSNDLPDPQVGAEESRQELQELLDRELTRLPDKYRVPIVLCELVDPARKDGKLTSSVTSTELRAPGT